MSKFKCLLCSIQNDKKGVRAWTFLFCRKQYDWCSVPRYAAGISYAAFWKMALIRNANPAKRSISAVVHFEVWDFLDRKFPPKWVGRDGPVIWPPPVPDLTQFDSFLGGGVHKGYFCLSSNIDRHFAERWWECTTCCKYSYTRDPCKCVNWTL